MSYQYPSPTTPPPPYDTGYPIPSQSTGMGMRSPGQPVKDDGDPATLHFDGKRESSSDPGLATAEQAQGNDPANMGVNADKKRGKLNYHRAGTACTNCRKRKIRCVQTRGPKCEQCQRLHKECVITAVDQQSSMDARNKPIPRPSAGHRLASAGSSPSMHHHVAMVMPPIQNIGLAEPPDLKMPPGAPMNRAYPDYGAQGMAGTWQPYSQTPPIVPNFSPYQRATPPPGAWSAHPVPGDASARDQMQWNSYPAPNQSFTAMSQMTADAYGRKTPNPMSPTEMYPSVPNMGSPHVGQPASMSPPESSSQVTSYGSWQQTYPPPSMSRPGEGFGGWYPEGEGGAPQPPPGSAAQQDWNWNGSAKPQQGEMRS
ncbi:hypothetical protein N8I77_004246 [Diaporthe amygdali]|uniref:Zn(2)-C6 fungal-type domain-containing protein n=1 Tax=Phomopsis amygdali TaxID=1214568 RepID=A0AAD9W5S0_PHOAM|nr:hypothetical protein N8I77_004246 [Diaporthe amygdali]KAK2610852.1 hypothetical protein N8I77_004246 [Diaporthe amygdali]